MERHRPLLAIALAFISLLSSTEIAAQPNEQMLLAGTWRHVSISHTLDGNQSPLKFSEGDAIAKFTNDMTWSLDSKINKSDGTYIWLDNSRIEQTIVNSLHQEQIGTATVKIVRVTLDRLELITIYSQELMRKTMPRLFTGDKKPNEMVITSVFSKVKQE